MKQFLFVILLAFSSAASAGGACGIEGTAVFPDGSKWDNSGVIKTSWDSKSVYPSKGRFELELDTRSCGSTITVYYGKNKSTKVSLPKDGGNVRLDLVYD